MTVRAAARRARSAASSAHCASLPASSIVERVLSGRCTRRRSTRVVTHSHRRRSMPACAVNSWLSVLSMAALVSTASPKSPRPPGSDAGEGPAAVDHPREAQVVAGPPGDQRDVAPARLAEGDRVGARLTDPGHRLLPPRPGTPPCRSSRPGPTGTRSTASTCTVELAGAGRARTRRRRRRDDARPRGSAATGQGEDAQPSREAARARSLAGP